MLSDAKAQSLEMTLQETSTMPENVLKISGTEAA
jgi:hypothetical protein